MNQITQIKSTVYDEHKNKASNITIEMLNELKQPSIEKILNDNITPYIKGKVIGESKDISYSNKYESSKDIPIPNIEEKPVIAIGKSFQWEGYVESIDEDKKTFQACMLRINENNPQREYTEFDFDEVPEGDRHLLQPGGIFRWAIGTEERNGIRQKYSRVVFRRLPRWSKGELKASQNEMIEKISSIKWANDVSPEL